MQRFSRLKMFDGFYWFHCSYQREVSIFCGLYSSLGDVISKNKPAKKIFAQRYIKQNLEIWTEIKLVNVRIRFALANKFQTMQRTGSFMLRAMKFSESGLKCWPCQCVLVISWTYSSRGNYLWKVSYPGNVTKSRGGEGGCVGRVSNPDWQYSRGDFSPKKQE